MDNSKSYHHYQHIKTYSSSALRRNSLVFGIIMVGLQIGLSLVYGFLINVQHVQLNISSVVVTIGLAILVIAGFGLLFGYTRKLLWSGIGFTFFITALCIEVYPLINDFWTKTHLQGNNANIPDFSFDKKSYNIMLSNRQTSVNQLTTFYGNSITNALKCALSISIAFSSILGRAGNLECLIVTLLGTVGFELNRQIVQQRQGMDAFGTYYIFTFGGFMGLFLGVSSYLRQRKTFTRINQESMQKYVANHTSVVHAAFGSLIIFALFPLLSYQFDPYNYYQSFSPYSNPVCIIVGMGAGVIGAIIGSSLINGSIIARDTLHGPIAGAIVVGASSLFITNPVFAFIAGFSGGFVQSLIQNIIEKRAANTNKIVSTVSWSLFGMQGLIGAGFASGWKAIVNTYLNGMTIEPKTLKFASQQQFYAGLISAGIGAACGIIVGLLLLLVNQHTSSQYFQDFYYWYSRDSIGYQKKKTTATPNIPDTKIETQKEKEKSKQLPKDPSQQPKIDHLDPYQPPFEDESDQFGYSVEQYPAQNPYAYL